MITSKRIIGIAAILVLLVAGGVPFLVNSGSAVAQDEPCEGCQQNQAEGEFQYSIMRPSIETFISWMEEEKNLPEAYINPQIQYQLERFPEIYGASVSLLSHLQYTPSERDQAYCGNCWVWAGTGVMAIALDVENSVNDRLSIQYLNSNYNGGSGVDWACCGGNLSEVASFYTGTGKAIPWSNTNAEWQDGGRSCSSGSTSVPAGTISTTPYYAISSIAAETITTHGVGEATAINNIKNILEQDRAIYFGFRLADNTDWSSFYSFWSTQSESAIWDPDPYCGHTWDFAEGGGHGVLCVGYNDDTGTANDYWIMLNSWGTAAGRPYGLFRVDMHMDYDCQLWVPAPYNQWLDSYSWQTLDITYDVSPPTTAPTLTAPANGSDQAGTSIDFSWTAATGATDYYLAIGEGVGMSPRIFSGYVTGLSKTVNGFPDDNTEYYWKVIGHNAVGLGPHSAQWSFINGAGGTPPADAPTLIAPANGSNQAGTSIEFEWTAVTGATDYYLAIGEGSGMSPRIFSGYVSGTSHTVNGFPDDDTEYYWKVIPHNSFGLGPHSAKWSFINGAGGTPPADAPTLVSPANGGSAAGTSIEFEWTAVAGATDYYLAIGEGSGMSPRIFSGYVAGLSKTVNGFPDDGTVYYWKVIPHNSFGLGPHSAQWSFTNGAGDTPPADAPTLVSPANGSNQAGTSIGFEWTAVTGATDYYLAIGEGSGMSPRIFSGYVAGLSKTVNGFPDDNTVYYWKVIPHNSFGLGPHSAKWSFINGAGGTPPADAPTLVSPANGGNTAGTSIEFEWTAVAGATDYYLAIGEGSGMSPRIFSGYVSGTSYTVNGFPDDGTVYYWKVIPHNSFGLGPHSAQWSFTNGTS